MRSQFLLCGALLALPGGALAAAPTPAPAVATPAPPSAAEIEASRAAVAAADLPRLFRDRAYAETMLVHLDRLAPLAEADPDFGAAVDNIRLFALSGLNRPDEVRAAIDRTLARRPTRGGLYAGPLVGAFAIEDRERAVATVENASRNVPGVGWAELRGILDRQMVGPLLGELHRRHEEDKRVRLAQALLRIGWPGGGDLGAADVLRAILIEDRLRAHDAAAAAEIASGLATPGALLPMIVQTRYDPVLAPGRDRIEILRQALADRDRQTAEGLAARPGELQPVLDRVQFLRAIGRDAEALELARPFTSDVAATVARGEPGMWLIAQAAYALDTLDRPEEADALMRRLTALPVAAHPALIGPAINRIDMLRNSGRFADALAQARSLDAGDARFANDYGKAWIAAGIACALAGLHRDAEAAPQLERLRGWAGINPGALIHADLCLGDEGGAAAALVRQLNGDDAELALLSLQDYALDRQGAHPDPLDLRLRAVRDRPEVREALGHVGRVLTLPLASSAMNGEF
jgi:hypothetical protein